MAGKVGWVTGAAAVGLALLCGTSLGCSRGESEQREEPVAPAVAEEGEAEAAAMGRAKAAAKRLGVTLKERLTEAMARGGPAAAISVCADEAQALTRQVERQTGVRVGRSSLRLRNPDNAGPAWVRAWLERQGERPAAGVEPLAEFEAGQARFVGPIVVEGLCVTCHGPRESLPEEVRSVLSQRYPEDRAVGYAPGDLRGAVWAAAPVGD